MGDVDYFKRRFKFALQGNQTIKLNRNDIEALNNLIMYADNQQINTNLEDSLLLFWLYCYWKPEIEESVLNFKSNGDISIKITNVKSVFDRLLTRMNARDVMIADITNELQNAQIEMGIERKDLIPKEVVKESMLDALNHVKREFQDLKDYKCVVS